MLAATIAFRGATLIDGTGAPPLPDSLLVVSAGRVVSVGPASPEAIRNVPAGTEVVAAEGKWIVPGWIDAHVHAETEEDLKTMLRWGVTSVRLMAEDVASSERLARGSAARRDIPEVFPAAPIFTAKGGWWDQGEPADANLNRFPSTPEEARAAVREAKALGSREIKVMLDDMAWCRAPKPPLAKLSRPVAEALVSEARTQGLRAIVHAPRLEDAKTAIAAGATALAHGVLDPIDDATLSVMRSRPVFYVPTSDIFEFLADTPRFLAPILADDLVTRRLPGETVRRFRSPEYSDGYRRKFPNSEFVSRHLPALAENLRRARAAGVPIALGTDMWAIPGLAVSVEMELYVQAGLTPLEAIRAATRTAAASLGVEDDRGTLEKGKRADLLVLSGDPVRDVRNARRIASAYKGGELLVSGTR